jgi:hypothetical protein
MWLLCVLCLVLQLPFFDPCFYLQPKFIIWFYHIHSQWGAIEWVCLITKQMPETDKSVSHLMVLIINMWYDTSIQAQFISQITLHVQACLHHIPLLMSPKNSVQNTSMSGFPIVDLTVTLV